MRRILMELLTTILILVAVFFLFTQVGVLASFIERGQSIISTLLALLQLVTLALAFALVILVLVKYRKYASSRSFIFEGFNNISTFMDGEKLAPDLDTLAQEELKRQFKSIYNTFLGHSDNVRQDFEALVVDDPYFEDDRSEADMRTINQSIKEIDMVGSFGNLGEIKRISLDLETPKLEEFTSEFANKVVINPLDSAKEAVPFLKFIEELYPPQIIRVTGHLQEERDRCHPENCVKEKK
jgi:hypothetical protein